MSKIGIVQHDDAIRTMYELKFKQAGFSVATAGTGHEGLEIVTGFNPEVMLLDLYLPHMHGFELLRKVGELARKATVPKFIVTTNNDPKFIRQKHPELSDHKYIIKAHYTPAQILSIAKDMLKINPG